MRPRRENDAAVSEVLGAVLMLAVVATLLPAALHLASAQRDAITAEREAAEQAAFCARNPSRPGCERYATIPAGYECLPATVAGAEVLLCKRTPGQGSPTANVTITLPEANTTAPAQVGNTSLLSPSGSSPQPTGSTPTSSATTTGNGTSLALPNR